MATEFTESSLSKLLVSLPSPDSLMADEIVDRKLDLEPGSSKSSENLLMSGVEGRGWSISVGLPVAERSGTFRYPSASVFCGGGSRGLLA